MNFIKFLFMSIICGMSITFGGIPENAVERVLSIYGVIGMLICVIFDYATFLSLYKIFHFSKHQSFRIGILCGIIFMIIYFVVAYLFFYK